MRKKFTLLFALLTLSLGVYAQTFVEPVAGKCYKIKGSNPGAPWLGGVVESGGIDVVATEEEAAIYLRTETGLKVVATGKFMGLNGSQISLVDTETPVTLESVSGTENRFYIKVNNDNNKYLHNNHSDYTREATRDATSFNTFGFVELVVTSAADLSNSMVYTVSTNDRGSWIYSSEKNALTSTYKTGAAVNADDPNQQFAFITVKGKVYLYSVGAGKFVAKKGDYTTVVDYPEAYVTLEASGNTNFPVVVALNGTNHMGISNGYNPAVITKHNDLNDAGNQSKIVAVADKDSYAYFKEGYRVLIAKAETLLAKMVASNYSETTQLSAALSTAKSTINNGNATETAIGEAYEALLEAYSAAKDFPFINGMVKNLQGGYYLVYYTDENNVKHYLQSAATNSVVTVTEGVKAYEISAGTTDGGKYSKSYLMKMNDLYISNTSENATNIETKTNAQLWSSQVVFEKDGKCAIRLTNAVAEDGWHGNYFIGKGETEGSTIALDPTTSSEDAMFIWKFERKTTERLYYRLTDEVGNVYSGYYEGVAGKDMPVLSGVTGYTFSDVVWNHYVQISQVTAKVKFPFPVSNATTTHAVMISSFNADNFLWRAEGNGVTVKKDIVADSKNYFWAIYPKFESNVSVPDNPDLNPPRQESEEDYSKFTFTIKNLGTGKYISSTSTENSHIANVVTLADEGSEFTLDANNQFKLATGKYLSINSSTATSVQYLGTWESHDGTKNKFVEVVEVSAVTLNKQNASLIENTTLQLTATVAPDNATLKTVTWNSSDTAVATVDANGLVTAVAPGEATITATAGDKSASCAVTVGYYVFTLQVDGEPVFSKEVKRGTNLATVMSENEVAIPTKEGYTFSGWALPEVMPAENLTLNGTYTINSYDVVYKVDGVVYQTVSVVFGTKPEAIAAPVKEGYTFSGWSALPETMPAEAVEVTGSFTINSYNVVYKYTCNGVVKYTETKSVEHGNGYPDYTKPYGVTVAPKPEGKVVENTEVEVVFTVELPFEYVESMKDYEDLSKADKETGNWKWYHLIFHSNYNKVLCLGDATTNLVDASKNVVDEANEDAYSWAFVGNPFDGFKVVNKEAGSAKGLMAGKDGGYVGDTAQVFKLTASGHGTNGFFMQAAAGDYTQRFNLQNNKLKYWSAADAGSTFQVKLRQTEAQKLAVLVAQAEDLLEENAANHAEEPVLGQYTTAGYEALTEAVGATDKTIESVKAAVAAFDASLNIPVYFITSAWDGGYPAGSAILYNGSAWRWAAANKFDKQMWMTIPGYTKTDVPVVGAYDANGTSYAICDYLTGTKMRGKDVQIVKIADWEGAYNLQYNADATSTDAAQHAQNGGALVNWKPAVVNDCQASAWRVEYMGTSYELAKLTDEHIVALAELREVYDANKSLVDLTFGTALGEYSGSKEALVAALRGAEAIFAMNLGQQTIQAVSGAIEAAKAAIVDAAAQIKYNLPVDGKYYRIMAVSEWNDDARYLGSKNSTANTSCAEFVADADEYTIFLFKDGYLKNYASGHYLVDNNSSLGYNGEQTSGSAIAFHAASNGLAAAYNISFNNGGRWLYCNKDNYTDASDSCGTDNGYCFNIEEVTELPVLSVTLDVAEDTLIENTTLQLTATVAPDNATSKAVTWSSSNTEVAIVDAANGLVTAVIPGEAIITATTTNGKTASCVVTVDSASYVFTLQVDSVNVFSKEVKRGTNLQSIMATVQTPAREGHTFNGWVLPEVMPTENLTLNGTFSVNSYNVFYVVDDVPYDTISVEYGAELEAIAVPSKVGHTFSGWSEIPDSMPANDVIISGNFTINSYTLTYTVDGDTVQTNSVVYNTEIVALEEPTKEGHTFSGWSEIPDSMPAKDVTIIGSFIINSYTLTYTVDGDTVQTDSVVYNTEIVALEEPTKEGHTFSGWSEIPDSMPAKDVTIIGSFIINSYTLTYTVDGDTVQTDSVVYNTEIVALEEPTKEGHTFSGWSEIPDSMPANDVTIIGSFAINSYTLTYTVDGDTVQTDSVVYNTEIVALEEPTKVGYTFSGWSEIPDSMPANDVTISGNFAINSYDVVYKVDGVVYQIVPVVFGTKPEAIAAPIKVGHTFSGWSALPETMPAEDVEVVGSFSANSYWIFYMVDGQTYKSVLAEFGTKINAVDEPTKEGHTFKGWIGLPAEVPAENIVVEASFTINSYDVVYKVDGVVYQTVSVVFGTKPEAIAPPIEEGYTFSGWSALPETMPAEDVEVVGSFSANSYWIFYMVDGQTYKSVLAEFGTKINAVDEPTKEGHTFKGWIGLPAEVPAENIVVEASFTVNSYTVSYIIDGKIVYEHEVEFGAAVEIPEELKEMYPNFEWIGEDSEEVYEFMPAYDIYFFGNDVTGLERLLIDSQAVIYDLSGRRVEKAVKGVYIINGRKVVIK